MRSNIKEKLFSSRTYSIQIICLVLENEKLGARHTAHCKQRVQTNYASVQPNPSAHAGSNQHQQACFSHQNMSTIPTYLASSDQSDQKLLIAEMQISTVLYLYLLEVNSLVPTTVQVILPQICISDFPLYLPIGLITGCMESSGCLEKVTLSTRAQHIVSINHCQ